MGPVTAPSPLITSLPAPQAPRLPHSRSAGYWLGKARGVRGPEERPATPGGRRPFRTNVHSARVSILPQRRVGGAHSSRGNICRALAVQRPASLICLVRGVPGCSARNSRQGRCERRGAWLARRGGAAQGKNGVSPVGCRGLSLAPLWFSSSAKT